MRIIALPLAKLKPSHRSSMLVFYHFDLASPCAGRSKEFPWHRKVLKNMVDKAADLWTSLGRAPKGSWKLRTYELGERMIDRLEFEELTLKNVDPSLGPIVPQAGVGKQVNDLRHSHPKIPLIYPPSLYPARADFVLNSPLTHLQTFLASHGPRHRRGFYLWMLIAPLTVPITLIPIIPNLPLFFCVWRSWSHYRAYRSSQYLSSLLQCGVFEPDPSSELDALYAASKKYRNTLPSLKPGSSDPLFGEATADGKSKVTSGNEPPQTESIILSRPAVSRILEIFSLPEAAASNIYRALDQARVRLEKS